ncbi:MAG: cation:proton antiporter [Burkholderiales bacterium]|nr:cation:proton antiporter [Burkholderiales bacterium]
MQELFYLPGVRAAVRGLPWHALLLLGTVLAGEAVQRWLHLPRMLGWIAVGALLGPHALGAIDSAALAAMAPIVQVAMGVVLFELGQRVDPAWLRRNPGLLGTSALEAVCAFGAVFAVLLAVDAPPLIAAVAAAIGISTSPAVILTVARELRAQGQVTERALLLSALNSAYAFVAVGGLMSWVAREHALDWRAAVLYPLYLVFGSLVAALAFAWGTLALLRLLGRRHDAQFLCVLALVAVAVWAADVLRLSTALTLLAYGVGIRILDRRRLFVALSFGRVGAILLILLFALTAARLDWRLVGSGALAGGVLVAARLAGKQIGVLALAPLAALPVRKASLLALALAPMSAVAIVLLHDTARLYPRLGAELGAIVVSAIAIMELLGPLLAHFALVRAGEAAPHEV